MCVFFFFFYLEILIAWFRYTVKILYVSEGLDKSLSVKKHGFFHIKEVSLGAGAMAQQFRALTALAEGPAPMPFTEMATHNCL